ncbi:hypothetical protein HH310_27070 [Actinoplanes sp. TBRC 11911]|uniref:hypothetical protein n=1 Tax=Actinoplanes sp. TBRC 11911 TaxID=2729386 RepID=UPI00145D6E74|nr:hypothetical protein [Actinoplanes sp. TBRC 11911]NMO54833.1 hypothetical protein [Actinoplanes sp. TBRC 11911]
MVLFAFEGVFNALRHASGTTVGKMYRRHAISSARPAATLRDEQIPAAQALFALRRAVDLLVVFATATREDQVSRSRLESEDRFEADRDLGQEATSRPGESTRFAKAWLLGSPAEVIRTEPVIAIVEQLLDDLIDGDAASAHASLLQAVRVLRVFAREHDNSAGSNGPAESATM